MSSQTRHRLALSHLVVGVSLAYLGDEPRQHGQGEPPVHGREAEVLHRGELHGCVLIPPNVSPSKRAPPGAGRKGAAARKNTRSTIKVESGVSEARAKKQLIRCLQADVSLIINDQRQKHASMYLVLRVCLETTRSLLPKMRQAQRLLPTAGCGSCETTNNSSKRHVFYPLLFMPSWLLLDFGHRFGRQNYFCLLPKAVFLSPNEYFYSFCLFVLVEMKNFFFLILSLDLYGNFFLPLLSIVRAKDFGVIVFVLKANLLLPI